MLHVLPACSGPAEKGVTFTGTFLGALAGRAPVTGCTFALRTAGRGAEGARGAEAWAEEEAGRGAAGAPAAGRGATAAGAAGRTFPAGAGFEPAGRGLGGRGAGRGGVPRPGGDCGGSSVTVVAAAQSISGRRARREPRTGYCSSRTRSRRNRSSWRPMACR